jgi:succinyl-diaminopimelate desuccinylase
VLTQAVLADPVALTRALVDIESVSGDEKLITDEVENALLGAAYLVVERVGNVVRARTELGRPTRALLAGHLDTVPLHSNFPSTMDDKAIWGCGTSDMKSGVALALHLATTLADPAVDVTYLFYDCEEIEAERNGLNQISRTNPDWLVADIAILLEPTYGLVEAGCQGTMRATVRVDGKRAHSARSWNGVNAIHRAGETLRRLETYQAKRVNIDGCEFREGLNAVGITGGVAGNVLPDVCLLEVNYRFAPDRSEADARAHLADVFDGYKITITDSAPGALPGLAAPAVQDFLRVLGSEPVAKFGWTDVSRFASLGIPALNFGPGDPNLAHKQDERVEIPKILACADQLRTWLTA